MPTQDEPRRLTHDVETREIPPAALEHALRLAGGDRSRLRFEKDGSIVVANEPRTGSARPTR